LYQKEEITIPELFQQRLTKERSVKALRARAKEGILVFIREDGRTQLFDRQLSVIRVLAARKCKGIGITWGKLSRVFKDLDDGNPSLNEQIIEWLNSGLLQNEVIEKTKEIIKKEL